MYPNNWKATVAYFLHGSRKYLSINIPMGVALAAKQIPFKEAKAKALVLSNSNTK